MLILLPPSEGKTAPRRGRPLDPTGWPADLGQARMEMVDALIGLGDSPEAARVLGLGPSQAGELARNAALRSAPAARADGIYSGVLFEALGFDTLSSSAKRRATSRIAITSSVFGLVRPNEAIPAYRLPGGVTLPGIGTVAAFWRDRLDPVVREMAGRGLIVDLRSSTYAAFWRPSPELARRVVKVRVLHEVDGRLTVVSHFNKATKGRLVRALLEDGRDPTSVRGFVSLVESLGWTVRREGQQVDLVVRDV